MSVRGDFRRLRELSASFQRCSKNGRQQILKLFAVDMAALTEERFQTSTDPYGMKWEGLKNPSGRRRGGKVLMDTRRLANSIRFATLPGAVRGRSNVVYAGIHNYGGPIKFNARTDLRRYAITGKDKRKRIDLFSRRKRSQRTVASVPSYGITMPKRQYLPDALRGLPPSYQARLRKCADQVLGYEGLLKGGAGG